MTSAAFPAQAPHRSRVIAGLLSFIAPGVGHLYAGQGPRGFALFAAYLVLQPILVLGATLLTPAFRAIALYLLAAVVILTAFFLFILIDAVRAARRATAVPPHRWYTYFGAVVLVWIAWYATSLISPLMRPLLPWRNFTVASTSMQPTLRMNEWLIADTRWFRAHAPARGDVVAYRLPSDNETIYLKRVIGLPGDRVAFREGHAIVNGVAASESFASFGDPRAFYATTAEVTVPAEELFVAGDNRANSTDSRVRRHGMVPLQNLVGRVTEISYAQDWSRLGMWVGSPAK